MTDGDGDIFNSHPNRNGPIRKVSWALIYIFIFSFVVCFVHEE